MTKSARRALFIVVAGAALALGWWMRPQTPERAPAPEPAAAEALMQASLPDLGGQLQSIGQWRGKVVVVNFWATWCAPCRDEIPALMRVQDELGPRGVQMVGIAIDQLDKVQPYAAELKINYPILIGELDAMELAQRAGNRLGGLPFTVVLTRAGDVASTVLGTVNEAKLHAIVRPLL
jgi:thiol-disulfide isomerase/thioredoxin